MKVVLVYRSKSRGRYSIETLFSAVAQALRPEVDVLEYSLVSKWGSWRDLVALYRLKADVYHVTGDVQHVAWILPRAKTVVTVHDLNHYLRGLRGFRRWLFKKLWFDGPLPRVAAVTAISEETKSNLRVHCPAISKEIRVIENCLSPQYRPEPLNFNERLPRILFVGSAPHKNLRRLSAALQGTPCKLVIVGLLADSTKEDLRRLGLDFENHVGLTDEALYRQYVDSDLVAFVSEREGFGLPIIEAQATGRPVVASNVSPMREVAGDGACLVNPFDVSEIRAGILRVIEDPNYRETVVAHGFQNVRRYSAGSIAAEYLGLYQEVASLSAQRRARCS